MNLLYIWSKCFSNCYFCTGPQGNEFVHKPFRSGVLVCSIPLGLLNISHFDFQCQMSWGFTSLVYVLGIGSDLCGTEMLLSSRIHSIVVRFFPLVGHCVWDRVLARSHLCLFYPPQCGLFVLCCGVAVQLVFRSFSKRIVLCVAVDLVYP